MKKMITMLLIAAMSFTMVGCKEQKPSLDEVSEAIDNGTLTIEDALSKGWVDQAWVDQRNEDMSVPAANKMTSNLLGDFETKTVNGEVLKKSELNALTYFAFLNPFADNADEVKEILVNAYPDIVERGGDILLILMKDETEGYKDMPFKTVLYDEALKTALGALADMSDTANEVGFTGSWNGNSAFITAWQASIDKEDLLSGLDACLEMMDKNDDNNAIKTMG